MRSSDSSICCARRLQGCSRHRLFASLAPYSNNTIEMLQSISFFHPPENVIVSTATATEKNEKVFLFIIEHSAELTHKLLKCTRMLTSSKKTVERRQLTRASAVRFFNRTSGVFSRLRKISSFCCTRPANDSIQTLDPSLRHVSSRGREEPDRTTIFLGISLICLHEEDDEDKPQPMRKC